MCWVLVGLPMLGAFTTLRAKGAKVNVIFQRLHVTCGIHVLVYYSKICIFHVQVISCVLNLSIYIYIYTLIIR